MTTYGGLTVAEWISAVSALVSAIIAILAIIDPGTILARPDLQTAIAAAFSAAVPVLLAVWAVIHHQTATTSAVIAANRRPPV